MAELAAAVAAGATEAAVVNDGDDSAAASTTATAAATAAAVAVTHVIFDLDGTLLDTERLVANVTRTLIAKYDKRFTPQVAACGLGQSPARAVAELISLLSLPCTVEEYLAQSHPMLLERLPSTKPLPGVLRLVEHLRAHNIPMAIATSSDCKTTAIKLSHYPVWKDAFSAIVCGDEVHECKPCPHIFLEAAKRLNASLANCLVFEDSPHGVQAAKAAGMRVVAVPSLPGKSLKELYDPADEVITSMLDFRPEQYGLPSIDDRIEGVLAMEPWRMKGEVIKGFGRGSKMLGIPTANLPSTAFSHLVAEATCGIYIGWSSVGISKEVHKMVMSVGWNPFFDNEEKTVEPWILNDFHEDFYGQELRLVVVGYIRPEANFPTLEALIERIHEDARIARRALDVVPFVAYEADAFLLPS